jgi:hypothetical protein
MLVLWQVKSIGISPLQYSSTFDNLHIENQSSHVRATGVVIKLNLAMGSNEVIPVTMPL